MSLSRRQICAYAALAIVVVALGVRYVVLPGDSSEAQGESLVLAPVASVSASADPLAGGSVASPVADATVYVCGAVRSPGVVRLPAGSRVADALELAGGATARAELTAVNLAAVVTDGQQIVVPERGAAGAVTAQATGAAGGSSAASSAASGSVGSVGALVNINTASLTELDALEGVGPATAQKIIDYRTANGPFKTIDEIKNVSGIGDAKFAAMKDSITV